MGKTVLIVEDEQSIVDILSFNLTKEGYDTLEALDGPTGLQLALEQNPDLVLLDLMLPGMSGFEVCERIRAAGSTTPSVMLTAFHHYNTAARMAEQPPVRHVDRRILRSFVGAILKTTGSPRGG